MKPHSGNPDKILIILLTIFFVIAIVFNFGVRGEQQFSYLADSFLRGKTYFLEKPGSWADTTSYDGRYYWPLGPFPAVIILPFVFIFNLINQFFYQGYLHFFIVLGVFYLVCKIARKSKYSFSDSLYLAFAFCFSSAFLGVAIWPWSWYFSQVVTVFLLFLAIYEYLGKKRHWLIGLIFGLVLATRFSASLAIVFFILELLLISKKSLLKKLRTLFVLLLPYGLALLLLFYYNFVRFGRVLEQGYSAQIIPDFATKGRDYGLLDLVHLPGNLYYFLLATPLPVFRDNLSRVLKFPFIRANPWGMSIFITSPYLIYLFFLKYKDRLSKLVLATVFIISLPTFLYYGIGWRQFGYRYSLDFLPILFFLLIRNFRSKYSSLSNNFRLLIVISAITNLYLFVTLFV